VQDEIPMLVALMIAVAVGFFVYVDAKRIQADGPRVGRIGAGGWFWGVTLFMIVFLPLYLFQRSRALRTSADLGSLPPPSPTELPADGWYPDPVRDDRYRYWDGSAWTDHTAPR
jgi:hypothetical protein